MVVAEKYKSSLQDGLVPAVPTRDEYPDAGTKEPRYKSSLAPDLTAKRLPIPADALSEAQPQKADEPPTRYASRSHLLRLPPPAPPVPAKAPSHKKEHLIPRTNIFTETTSSRRCEL